MSEDEQLAARKPEVRAAVLAGIAGRRRLRRRLVLVGAAGAALVVVAGAAEGATRITAPESPDIVESVVTCYLGPDLRGYQEVQLVETLTDAIALDVCSQESRYPESELAICEASGGTRAVVPQGRDVPLDQVCDRAGLPDWDD